MYPPVPQRACSHDDAQIAQAIQASEDGHRCREIQQHKLLDGERTSGQLVKADFAGDAEVNQRFEKWKVAFRLETMAPERFQVVRGQRWTLACQALRRELRNMLCPKWCSTIRTLPD